MADYTGMKVADLQQELRHRGLPTSGRKAELLARLQSATARAPARASQPRHHAVPRSAASPETQSPDDSHVPPTRQSEPKAVKSSKKRKATASSIDEAAEPRSKRPAATPASPMAAESGSSMASGPAGTLLLCPSRDASVCLCDLVLLATYPTHRMTSRLVLRFLVEVMQTENRQLPLRILQGVRFSSGSLGSASATSSRMLSLRNCKRRSPLLERAYLATRRTIASISARKKG